MSLRLLLPVLLLLPEIAVAADAWPDTLERISPSIVSVTIDRVRAFDTTFYANSQATAFVVDAERGILLTNRHVVSPGPVVAEALFLDGEEVPLVPLYRDPVHDFGFFAYDPEELRHIAPRALPLAPDAAAVGLEIRVVGNDAGEKLSILAGTLARLDRPAPDYGRGNYNDFNTFYFQAASSTSGGSSGSPVIDVAGRVVALNAGSNRGSASSFYLPLDRVARALAFVQRGETPPRGSLQATFVHQRFDELARLGLSRETQEAVRAAEPEATGMLAVEGFLPGGVADGVLRVGDVVVAVEGAPVRGFVDLEAVLDDGVGRTVRLTVERAGQRLELPLPVADLHAITPADYVELGGGILHDLSYQQARLYHLPLTGVFVADDGYVLDRADVPYRAVITALDDRPTPDLDAFVDVYTSLPTGRRARVRYLQLDEPERERTAILEVDRRWFPTRRCTLAQGPWPCVDLPEPGTVEPVEGGTATLDDEVERRAARALRSIVTLDFDVPYTVDGVRGASFVGTGVVVDAEAGLVATDRNTVPITLGDAVITVAGQVRVPAEVVAVHPLHGVALLRYDPSLLGETPLRAAELGVAPLEEGEDLWYVGRQPDQRPEVERTTLTRLRAVQLPAPSRPRFVESNLEVGEIGAKPRGNGVLVDRRGRVRALWGSYSFDGSRSVEEVHAALPAWLVEELVDAWRRGEGIRSLEVGLTQVSLADARDYGLPDAWVEALAAHDRTRRALQVAHRTAGAPSAELLRDGDILLSIDGAPVTRFREVELAARGEEVTIELLRAGQVVSVAVPTRALSLAGVERVVLWAGAYLQETPYAASALRLTPPHGVYVDLRFRGSPSMRAGLPLGARVRSVDGQPTPDLDRFLEVTRAMTDRQGVRLELVDLEGRVRVVTLKLDLHAFPTTELRRVDGVWTRSAL